MKASHEFKYVRLADDLQQSIRRGTFAPGEKLPSLRKLNEKLGISITTVHQAYIELEKRGLVQAKEKSGFFVSPIKINPLSQPKIQKSKARPSRVRINELARTIIKDLQSEDVLQLGASVPSRELMPLRPLARIMKALSCEILEHQIGNYDPSQGNPHLREAIARRMAGMAADVTPEDVVTTNGCLEAVSLCLRAVAAPGDTILVESPVFHCFLQLIEDLNMYALELPGRPDTGIDPESFKQALAGNKIAACLLNPNFQNPLGSVIPTANKAAILKTAQQYCIPIIEDDIYGDLYFGKTRPDTFKSLDKSGMVLYCSSFSKSLAPGLRTGWALPGRFMDAVLRLKLNTNISSPSILHRTTAQFINTGAYDRHLRQYRRHLKNQASAMASALSAYFPKDTRITFPPGGMFIWVELNKAIDSFEVYQQAYKKKISILPGIMCATSDKYRNCLRINCGMKWSPKMEQGIRTLGRIIS